MMKIIRGKWTVEILRECAIGPTRTGQFLARIPGLSMKSLQERIKELENSGFVARIKYNDDVQRVEHLLTDRGTRLLKIMVALKDLATEISPHRCNCPIELAAFGAADPQPDCPNRRNDSVSRRREGQ